MLKKVSAMIQAFKKREGGVDLATCCVLFAKERTLMLKNKGDQGETVTRTDTVDKTHKPTYSSMSDRRKDLGSPLF